MYRERNRACPGCSAPMTRVPLEDPARGDEPIEIDRCDLCGGTFLEFFDGEPIGLAKGAVASAPERRTEAAAAPPRCPDCEIVMVERAYLDVGPMLARCDTCLAVYVSRERLEELAATRMKPADDAEPRGWLERLLGLFGS